MRIKKIMWGINFRKKYSIIYINSTIACLLLRFSLWLHTCLYAFGINCGFKEPIYTHNIFSSLLTREKYILNYWLHFFHNNHKNSPQINTLSLVHVFTLYFMTCVHVNNLCAWLWNLIPAHWQTLRAMWKSVHSLSSSDKIT